MRPRMIGKATAKSPSRYAEASIVSATTESTTAPQIHPQAALAGRPNTPSTMRLGNAAPMTIAATAPFASPRDFTQAFQTA